MGFFFFFQAEDGIRDLYVTGVQTCALPISPPGMPTRYCASAWSSAPAKGLSGAEPSPSPALTWHATMPPVLLCAATSSSSSPVCAPTRTTAPGSSIRGRDCSASIQHAIQANTSSWKPTPRAPAAPPTDTRDTTIPLSGQQPNG